MHTLAFKIGLNPAETAVTLPLTDPDAILQELQATGITLVRDIGAITTLEELRPLLQGKDSRNIYADAKWKIWTTRNAHQHHKITPSIHILQLPNQKATLNLKDEGNPGISQEDLILIAASAPQHPEDTMKTIPILAFLTSTTPQATHQYLDSGAPSPAPPPLKSCPLTQH